jgi:hypothetical protein
LADPAAPDLGSHALQGELGLTIIGSKRERFTEGGRGASQISRTRLWRPCSIRVGHGAVEARIRVNESAIRKPFQQIDRFLEGPALEGLRGFLQGLLWSGWRLGTGRGSQ